ncbi:MAG: hypothetical protein ABJH99_11560, partial [Tateyamaria sp.]
TVPKDEYSVTSMLKSHVASPSNGTMLASAGSGVTMQVTPAKNAHLARRVVEYKVTIEISPQRMF